MILLLSITPLVRNALGMVGNPTLQVGGEHEAVTLAEPGVERERVQDWVHPVAVAMAPGFEEVHVSGIFVSTIALLVFGKELLPMTSVTVATAVCRVPPFAIFIFVWPEPAVPISRAMFCTGQVAKKSRTGEVAPDELVRVGCWNDVLDAPLADAEMYVIPGVFAVAVTWLVGNL